MREIKEGSYLDYIFIFGEVRSKGLDNNVEYSLGTNGKFLILYEEGKSAGFLCYGCESGFARVISVYTREEVRRKGVCTELLQYAVQSEKLPMQLAVMMDRKDISMLLPIISNAGFHKLTTNVVYGCQVKDVHRWDEYMETSGGKMVRLLERQGFETVNFADASAVLKKQLLESGENHFQNKLDVACFFQQPTRGLKEELSYIVYKKDKLAAYCLVSQQQKKIVCFEQFSVAKEFQGTGILLLCFAKAMEQLKRVECERVWYEINEDNTSSNAFRDKVLEQITSDRRTCEIYRYQKY